MTTLSVVAPIYNEASVISEFVNQVEQNLKQLNISYEIILIDDGSSDGSWNAIQLETKKSEKIKAIQLSKNFGHHYAITAGIHNSKGDWVVIMDTDLQDRPEVILDLYKKANEGFDIVFVSRTDRPESFVYKILQKFFYIILRFLSGIDFDSSQANFSIINKKVAEAFKKFPEQARFYGSTIKWLGFDRTEIYAKHGQRFSGKPSYSLSKRIKLATDIVIAFSGRPLRFAVSLGLIMSGLSTFFGIALIVKYLTQGFQVLGWASLMVSIFFTSGVILTVLGIIGIYLGRVFHEVKSRPLYLVSKSINVDQVQ
jgi:glycosyltransferase involved in cell wall biosynthesis